MVTIMRLSICQMLKEFVRESTLVAALVCFVLATGIFYQIEPFEAEPLRCISPEAYLAFPCNPWAYEAHTTDVFAKLATSMHELKNAMNITVLTSRHVGHGFCMLVARSNSTDLTMFNPRILSSERNYRRIQETSVLCNTTQAKSRSTNITLEWTNISNNTITAQFTNLEAYQLQHALDILQGTFQCV